MNLKHLTDKTLHLDTKNLAAQERELTVKILHHLKEIDRRKLYSDYKYSSLYEYCIKELSYTEASAQRRITAARMLKDIPEIEIKIESGKLSLSNIASAGKFFKENDIVDIKQKKDILEQVEKLSARECDQKLFVLSGNDRPKTTTLVILDESYVKLQQVKDLLGRIVNIDELIEYLVSVAIEDIKKKKFKQVNGKTPPPTSEVKRVIPANIKRIVYKRDKKCVKCGSIHKLNYDHKKPYALGGKTTLDNIRLLCFNCNQRQRIIAKL